MDSLLSAIQHSEPTSICDVRLSTDYEQRDLLGVFLF